MSYQAETQDKNSKRGSEKQANPNKTLTSQHVLATFCGGDVAQLAERRAGTLLTRVYLPGAARYLSPGVNFQCRLPYDVRRALVRNRMYKHLCAH